MSRDTTFVDNYLNLDLNILISNGGNPHASLHEPPLPQGLPRIHCPGSGSGLRRLSAEAGRDRRPQAGHEPRAPREPHPRG